MQLEPIACLRPGWNVASTFATMPYDLYDGESARKFVTDNSRSFLAIDRPDSNFPESQVPDAATVYGTALRLLGNRLADGTLIRDGEPCFYIWLQETHGHAQIGIVGACAVEDCADGTIRRHEGTLPERVARCEKYLAETGIQGGPLFLTYRDDAAIDGEVARRMRERPLYGFIDLVGCRNTVWRVSDPTAIARIRSLFTAVPRAYIADGHHRAEAACAARRAHGAGSPYDYILVVLIPDNQLLVRPYDRVVPKPGIPLSELVARLQDVGFSVKTSDSSIEPHEPYTYGMYADGQWYRLSAIDVTADDDPVSCLDVSVLQERVFAEALGIRDFSDGFVKYIGGAHAATKSVEKAGPDGCAFTLRPTPIGDVMSVADADMLMPPKSTWFEPKLLSGLFIRLVK